MWKLVAGITVVLLLVAACGGDSFPTSTPEPKFARGEATALTRFTLTNLRRCPNASSNSAGWGESYEGGGVWRVTYSQFVSATTTPPPRPTVVPLPPRDSEEYRALFSEWLDQAITRAAEGRPAFSTVTPQPTSVPTVIQVLQPVLTFRVFETTQAVTQTGGWPPCL